MAWLSQFPIGASSDVVDFPTILAPVQVADDGTTIAVAGRGALAITITSPSGLEVHAIAAHLKSKLLTFPGGKFSTSDEDLRARFGVYALNRRAAEAAMLRTWATQKLTADPQAAIIVAGDLNDTTQAATTQLLHGAPGSHIGTRSFDTPDQGDPLRLWNLAPWMPPGQDYSRNNSGRKELIDHLLTSQAIVRTATYVHAVIDNALPYITNDPTPRRNTPASDHAPVVATFLGA